MRYGLTSPCAQCPFRSDIRPYLSPARAREILASQGDFWCHKTCDGEHDQHEGGSDDYRKSGNEQACAGFLICLEHEGAPNQLMRIAGRLGLYDPRKLKMDAPVYRSVRECLRAHFKARRR